MKKNILSVILIFALLAVSVCGCASKPVEKNLMVHIGTWSEMGGNDKGATVYSTLEKGMELYNGYASTITVKSVSEDKIVLSLTGCLVEPNEDGTINMNIDPLKKVTLNAGESIELVSQTMDGGVNLYLTFE